MKNGAFLLVSFFAIIPAMFLKNPVNKENYKIDFIKDISFYETEEYPSAIILKNSSDLDNFVNRILNDFKSDPSSLNFYDQYANYLRELFAPYDARFFCQSNLVIGLLDKGSGSLRFQLQALKVKDSALILEITKTIPPIMTMDYRKWGFMLNIEKNFFNGEDIQIKITEERL